MDTREGGWWRLLGPSAFAGIVLLAACTGRTTLPAQPTSVAPVSAGPAASFVGSVPGAVAALGTNLIVNGGADLPFANADCSLSVWQPNLGLETAAYGSAKGEPTADSPGPPDRGRCYFRMDVGAGASDDTTTQVIDVSAVGSQIDAGSVKATLSGWFGGAAGAHYDYTVRFLDAGGGLVDVMSAESIDLPTDPTALALSTATMDVPADTRRLEVNFTLDYDGDCSTCPSVAYADSLSLVLNGG